jgi:hypothetical protein
MSKAAYQIIAIHTEALTKPIGLREQYITNELSALMVELERDDDQPIRNLQGAHAALALAPNLAAPKPSSISGRRK